MIKQIYKHIYIFWRIIFGTITNLDFNKSVFVTLMIPIDLQKTFVAISHQVLLKRVKVTKYQTQYAVAWVLPLRLNVFGRN